MFCAMSKISLCERRGLEVLWRSLGVFGGTAVRVQFGDCVFDSGTRELLRAGEPAHLSPKAFHVLELLLQHRPRALSKDELHRQVWPDTFVSEATLASAIAEIRAALRDTADKPRYLRTVHAFGYAFSGQATDSKTPAPVVGSPCLLVWGDTEIPLNAGENLLGRGEDVAVRINDNSVSRHHARIALGEQSATLEDLQSKNGTFVGASRITQPTRLDDGVEIRLGDVVLTFRLVTPAGSTETVEDRKQVEGPPPTVSRKRERNASGKRRNHG